MRSREEIEEYLDLHKTEILAIRQDEMRESQQDINRLLIELQLDLHAERIISRMESYSERRGNTYGWIRALEWVLEVRDGK